MKGLPGRLKGSRLDMSLLLVQAEVHPREERGDCRTMIMVSEGRALGGCGVKIRGWMCGSGRRGRHGWQRRQRGLWMMS